LSQGAHGAPQSLNISLSATDGSLRTALAADETASPDNLLDIAADFRDGNWHDYVLTVDALGHARVHVDGTLRVENNVRPGTWNPPPPLGALRSRNRSLVRRRLGRRRPVDAAPLGR
jgi:hypothetical protein